MFLGPDLVTKGASEALDTAGQCLDQSIDPGPKASVASCASLLLLGLRLRLPEGRLHVLRDRRTRKRRPTDLTPSHQITRQPPKFKPINQVRADLFVCRGGSSTIDLPAHVPRAWTPNFSIFGRPGPPRKQSEPGPYQQGHLIFDPSQALENHGDARPTPLRASPSIQLRLSRCIGRVNGASRSDPTPRFGLRSSQDPAAGGEPPALTQSGVIRCSRRRCAPRPATVAGSPHLEGPMQPQW